MKLSNEEVTGGTDLAVPDTVPLVEMEAHRQSRAVLARILRLRIAADTEHGFFRDYPDWAKTGPSWSEQLYLALGAHALLAVPAAGDTNIPEAELIDRLEQGVEIAVCWIEALERRADERLQRIGFRLTWWQRLRRKLGYA